MGKVEVWTVSLELGGSRLENLRPLLSPDEVDRASRYRFPRDRDRFVAARGVLRLLLSSYLGSAPEEIRFSYGRHGKPSLAESPERLGFNLSHSAGRALYAVAMGRQVGIDLEHRDTERDWESLAPRMLTEAERNHLVKTPDCERIAFLIRLWTRKEAFAKAVGWGLGHHPASIRTDPQVSPSVVMEENGRRRDLWLVHDLSPWPGFIGSVAAEEDLTVTMRNFEDPGSSQFRAEGRQETK